MKLNKITIFLIIGLITASFQPTFGEEYYYIEYHKLTEPPVFCAGEFKDPLLPEAETILIEKTEQAVSDWESRLIEHTGNKDGWDFQFRTIPEDYKASDVSDCDIFFYYKRQSSKDLDEPHGFSFNLLGFSGITIYYLENVYSGNIKEIEIKGEKILSPIVSHYENRVSPYIDLFIKHEIGHALGLDHPSMAEFSYITTPEGNPTISSIMFGNDPTIFEDGYVRVITDYDIRAVVNLYGEEGIKPSLWFWELIVPILFGGLMAIIGFVLYLRRKTRMKKQKDFQSLAFDANNS